MILRVAMTFAQFAEIYIEQYAKAHKKSWEADATRMRLYMIPAWGDMELTSITVPVVAALHASMKDRPYQANRVLENVSTMFNFARTLGHVPANFPNPRQGIKEYKEKQRLRFLSRAEAKDLLEAIQAENEYVRAAILLYLLTGLRKSEILNLKWRSVNLQEGYVSVEDTKNGETVIQPLSSQAVAVLASMRRVSGNSCVIVGAKPGKPRNTIHKAWARVRRRARITDVRIHDLRRTVGAWLTIDDVPLQTVKEVLNHKDIKTTLVYARLPSKSKRDHLQNHGDKLASLLDNVSSLPDDYNRAS